MKKIILLFLLIFSFSVLVSCGEEPNIPDDPTPIEPDDPVVNYVITISEDVVILNVGEEKQVTATVDPSTTLIWDSSDKGVATCSNGLIKGIKAGDATITVFTSDGKAKKEIKVKVNEVIEEVDPVEELSLALYKIKDNYINANSFNVYIEVKSGSSTSSMEMIYNKNSSGLYDEFFYEIKGNVEIMVYIKDGISYMKEESNMKKATLSDSEAQTIVNDYNAKQFLGKVISFYDEVSFYNALEEVSVNKFKLNLEKYEGKALNVDGISEVILNVSYSGEAISSIELVYSNGNSVKVYYRGHQNVTVPEPSNLDKFTE